MNQSEAVKEKSESNDVILGEAYLNLPNSLTILRILLIPVFVWLFSEPSPDRALAAGLVFACAAFTDFLDGYLARKSGQITNLGKLLDPVADKLLVASGLILLVQFQRVAVWLAIVMIARELLVTGARAVAAKEGFVVPADSLGKFKVIGQIGGILCLILQGVWVQSEAVMSAIGTGLLYIALFFSIFSGWRYLMQIFKKISPQYW
ncbi:MAG: CDP-diacylglycerol--glycerol-3-phosphate 3-phosphatidyltransferase [Nitrospira sp.]|nr:CDP-diacylglycerol--glycerol-3-phosphate 3-phosphatidyltransferase [Nitrospira sp.]HBP90214.1 CDP-diacylglycerol--glycerol-3-phosphate 3-phosphatidyltransferase [Nitrospiraceae bacterium]HNP27653.1 CDP-diacylglycerol--glycerol-3-phosphate 3-phosphatidyltransferase [Nitrospirales bacterium]